MTKTNTKGLTAHDLEDAFFQAALATSCPCLFYRPALDELYRRASESGVTVFTDNVPIWELVSASIAGWAELLVDGATTDPFTPAQAILFLRGLNFYDYLDENDPRVY